MEVDLAEARKTFDTNFFAVIAMCQTFVPLLIKAKGTIVQLGSVAGVRASRPLVNWKENEKRS
jgi:1-acylglycerone phosphate reductase